MSLAPAGPLDRLWASRRRWPRAVIVPLLFAVVACDLKPPSVQAAAEPPTSPVAAAAPVAVDEAAAPTPVPVAKPGPALAARPPAPPPTLVGMSREEVTELLGPPMFRRRDTPAEIWQYRGPSCTLDLFLYKDAKGDTYKVAHVEARGKNAAKVGQSDCLGRFLIPERKARAG